MGGCVRCRVERISELSEAELAKCGYKLFKMASGVLFCQNSNHTLQI